MSILNIISTLSRLSVHNVSSARSISTLTNPLYFQVTNALLAEPLKKKKKMDPAIIRNRIERKKKKINKQIRKLEKQNLLFKPIHEIDSAVDLAKEIGERQRVLPPISKEEKENRAVIEKEWGKYKNNEHKADICLIESVLRSQQKALDQLKASSEELYNAALQIDESLIPYKVEGPLRTPPRKDYPAPDGDYKDITKKFEGEDQII